MLWQQSYETAALNSKNMRELDVCVQVTNASILLLLRFSIHALQKVN
jgi:hypothetical protein